MKQKNHKWQQGFAILELAIFVIALLAVGGIGYWALTRSKAASTATSVNNIVFEKTKNNTLKANSISDLGMPATLYAKSKFIGQYRVNITNKDANKTWLNITDTTGAVITLKSSDPNNAPATDGSSAQLVLTIPKYICSRNDNKIDGSGTWNSANIKPCSLEGKDQYSNSNVGVLGAGTWEISITDFKNAAGVSETGNSVEFIIKPDLAINDNIGATIGQNVTITAANGTKFDQNNYQVLIKEPGSSGATTVIASTDQKPEAVAISADKQSMTFKLTNTVQSLLSKSDITVDLFVREGAENTPQSNTVKMIVKKSIPTVTVTQPTANKQYTYGVDKAINVEWTTDVDTPNGDFCVDVVNATNGAQAVANRTCEAKKATGGKTFSQTNYSILSLQPGNYKIKVNYRPTSGGGVWFDKAGLSNQFEVINPSGTQTDSVTVNQPVNNSYNLINDTDLIPVQWTTNFTPNANDEYTIRLYQVAGNTQAQKYEFLGKGTGVSYDGLTKKNLMDKLNTIPTGSGFVVSVAYWTSKGLRAEGLSKYFSITSQTSASKAPVLTGIEPNWAYSGSNAWITLKNTNTENKFETGFSYRINISGNNKTYYAVAKATSSDGTTLRFQWPKTEALNIKAKYKVTITNSQGKTSNPQDFRLCTKLFGMKRCPL